jgi:hypothetical protein
MVNKSDGVLPLVTPAKAGVHILSQVKPGTSPSWIPASAGMTESGDVQSDKTFGNWYKSFRLPLDYHLLF